METNVMSMKAITLTPLTITILVSASLVRAESVVSEPAQTGLCKSPMEVRFSCAISKDNRRVSICADGPDLKLFLGKPDEIEISLPRGKGNQSVKGWLKNYRVDPEEPVSVEAELTFQDGAVSYTIANTLDDDKRAGYEKLVIREGKRSSHDIAAIQKL
jgi:hypothetical protein